MEINKSIAYCGLNCETCGDCKDFKSCEKLAMIIKNNKEAINNLKN